MSVTSEQRVGSATLAGEPVDLELLASVERRVLWLATATVDHANRVRQTASGLKVGGHQASSASLVTIMTALWFSQLAAEDRVSVKPHASPVLHAIEHLLGTLPDGALETLRQFGGLQSYPSRLKDPVPADYSTGSVGIGATAPIWGAIARRYAGGLTEHPTTGRQYSLVGDAELDEGAVWEALVDPSVAELGELVWIVDFNRQSLDRVVPAVSATRLQAMFAAAGWQVLTVKYGHRLEDILGRDGGDALRERLDAMSNPEYQRLLRLDTAGLRERLPGTGERRGEVAALIAGIDDARLRDAVGNLGGHDMGALLDTFAAIDDTRPTVVFAYTVKGNGLPTAGHPQNHSALLDVHQMQQLALDCGTSSDAPWARFDDCSAEGRLCRTTARRLHRDPIATMAPPVLPTDFGRTPVGTASTQQALGRTLLDLTRGAPEAARRIVTVAPDVASSTNLGGWVNKVGAWAATERVDWFADDAQTRLHWKERPDGQHIELGIAEVNLVGLLGELGATWSRWGQPLIPIGVLYDPFVERALEPWSFGIYAGGQSLLVGTPSGVTLAPEGGAHQSIKTPTIGIEQPGCLSYEPAFVVDAEWCLLAVMAQMGRPGGTSGYVRLSTRPVPQSLAGVPEDATARGRRRRQVVAGGYPLRRSDHPAVALVAVGAMVTEALEAADQLGAMGVPADVVCVTSPDLLYRALRARRGQGDAATWILDQLFPRSRAVPVVTVLDGHPHALSFLAAVNGVPGTDLGVTGFGQSGDVQDLYRHHGIDAASIVTAALDLVDQ